ncbi:MAG: hypothetical protein AAF702_35590 [Chloroflexota bacterium]
MDFLTGVGLWFGFLLSLMTFSLIFRDNILARLAQHILVGAATGYLMVLLIQDVLRPKLFNALVAEEGIAFDLLVPLILGSALLFTMVLYTLRQGRNHISDDSIEGDVEANSKRGGSSFATFTPFLSSIISLINRIGSNLGRVALLLIISVGMANAIAGAIQGTLLPQFWQATRLEQLSSTNWPWAAGSVLVLLITIGVILHLYVAPSVNSSSSGKPLTGIRQSPLIVFWSGIGKRGLWFAAGVLFARLAASRLSLLIVWLESIIRRVEESWLWQQIFAFL